MPQKTETTDQIKTVTEALKSHRLPASRSPNAVKEAIQQQQAKVAVAGATADISIAASLGAIAQRIGLDTWQHDWRALQGGLLTVLDGASDPARIEEFLRRNAAFEAARRRPISGVRALVSAPHPGEEMKKSARQLRLRHDVMVGAFSGRASLDELVTIGRQHRCSIDILVDNEKLRLVEGGEVDDTVLGLARLAEGLTRGEVAKATTAPLPPVEPATEESGDKVGSTRTEVKALARSVGFGRSGLGRPGVAKAGEPQG